jgi:predicted transcriptional regulator
MARKPNVATEDIVSAIFASEDKALTTRDLGATSVRLNSLVKAGVLTQRVQKQKVEVDGKPSRGRPRYLYGLSKRTRDKLNRQARKTATA